MGRVLWYIVNRVPCFHSTFLSLSLSAFLSKEPWTFCLLHPFFIEYTNPNLDLWIESVNQPGESADFRFQKLPGFPMAHATSDSDEFRLVSGARSGLKREFAFALKNQSDFTASPTGRTRGNKEDPSAKRLKMDEESESDPVQTESTACMDEKKSEAPVVIDENVEEQKPPVRRFTRSLLKPQEEPQTSSGGSTVVSEEACTKDDVISPLKRPSNNTRLEMKMSKKIALHKVPANIRDLLNTGFLDGLSVKYLFLNKRVKLLHLFWFFF